jgi:hypothetical protein
MNAKADRIFRGQGNNAGRGRMRQDGVTLRDPAPPRGVTLSTGEDVPRGESLQARVWNLEVSPGDIDFDKVKACQKEGAAGLYAECMSAFLKWVAPQYVAVTARLRELAEKYSLKATRGGQHARTPEIIANLMAGMCLFVGFAREVGAISEDEGKEIRTDTWKSLLQAAAAQTRGLTSEDPARRFLELIGAAILRGDAHLGDARGGGTTALKGRLVGWWNSDRDTIWLDLDSAFAVAQELARQQAEPFPVRMKTLGNRLKDRGLLATYGKHRNTVQRKVGEDYHWVLCLWRKDILPLADLEPGATSTGLADDEERDDAS